MGWTSSGIHARKAHEQALSWHTISKAPIHGHLPVSADREAVGSAFGIDSSIKVDRGNLVRRFCDSAWLGDTWHWRAARQLAGMK
jgi:hypothetical protein